MTNSSRYCLVKVIRFVASYIFNYAFKYRANHGRLHGLTRYEVLRLLKATRSKRRIDPQTGQPRFHSYARWHLAFFILLALYTAARKEAILTLTWSQVDFESRIIDLNKPGVKITNKRRAIIPIPDKLMTFLRIAKSRAPINCSDKYVIEYFGKPILRIDQSFRRVARDAGLNNVTPHTLRHTSATWMAQANVPMWVISKYLGHTSTRTTERIYAHHNPTFLMEAKQALERRPANPLASSRTGLRKRVLPTPG
jgi:integrase